MQSKLSYEACLSVAAMFSARKDFRAKADREYQWLKRNGLMDQACAHMVILRRDLGYDDIAKIASQYTHRRAFKIGDQSAYQSAIKRGILDSVCAHMETKYRILTDNDLAKIALKYKTKLEFLNSDPAAYQTADKRGILNDVCAHMNARTFRRLSDEEILSIAKTFKTRNDLKLGDFGAYTTAIRRGLIVDACDHMEYGFCGFRDDKPATLYQFRIETCAGVVLYKVGITNKKPHQRMMTMGIQSDAKVELMNFTQFNVGRDARMAEKALHKVHSVNRYNGQPIMNNGNTELFTIPIL